MSLRVDYFQQKHVSFSLVETKDLPFHCPPEGTSQWNMHPKVYLKFTQSGQASCPYCGANYRLAK